MRRVAGVAAPGRGRKRRWLRCAEAEVERGRVQGRGWSLRPRRTRAPAESGSWGRCARGSPATARHTRGERCAGMAVGSTAASRHRQGRRGTRSRPGWDRARHGRRPCSQATKQRQPRRQAEVWQTRQLAAHHAMQGGQRRTGRPWEIAQSRAYRRWPRRGRRRATHRGPRSPCPAALQQWTRIPEVGQTLLLVTWQCDE
mmetsp:Transcript_1568/g.5007  ORF Transcript_1568/g.5007 Transcript_1568/m.5007 type:complete len:200 (+) Transcript_1568:697-1296(+)